MSSINANHPDQADRLRKLAASELSAIDSLRQQNERLLTVLKVAYVTLVQGVDEIDLVKLEEGISRALAEAEPSWDGLLPVNYQEVLRP